MISRSLVATAALVLFACNLGPSWGDDYPCVEGEYAESNYDGNDWSGFDCQPLPEACDTLDACIDAVCGEEVSGTAGERNQVNDGPVQMVIDCVVP